MVVFLLGGGLFSLPFSFCFLALPFGSPLCVLLVYIQAALERLLGSNIFLFLPIKIMMCKFVSFSCPSFDGDSWRYPLLDFPTFS